MQEGCSSIVDQSNQTGGVSHEGRGLRQLGAGAAFFERAFKNHSVAVRTSKVNSSTTWGQSNQLQESGMHDNNPWLSSDDEQYFCLLRPLTRPPELQSRDMHKVT